ncbi:MAG: PDZ domain-containing protein [Planctomycetes bacterium]|nr:PDZ domain-containing protein [Planctomycetota bacterium]
MSRFVQRVAIVLVVLSLGSAALAESHLMRMADVHQDKIVFTYEGDLWLASTAGGYAHRITNDPGQEVWAKFSPDGQRLAFTAQYDGGLDVYVMDARGGVPQRLTYHPAMDRVLGWFPDGQHVLFRSNRVYPNRGEEIYKVSIAGGMPERLPVDRAGLAALSPDGKQIAYNRMSRESRTWKRHQGGTAQDIWLGSLEKRDYRRITDWPGSDNYPMWRGDAIYFSSDREHGTLNLYKYDLGSGQVTALTSYKDYDVKYPSLGLDQIVYQYAETLYLLDLKNGKSRQVPVEIPSDLVRMRPEFVGVSPSSGSFNLSPSATRMLVEARGEIINFPVEDGEPINLTKTTDSREKNAAWSPNGRWIAFLSDKTGEEEIYFVDQKGAQPWKQLTKGGLGFRLPLVWSPDSKYLLFSDKFMRLNLVAAETGEITAIDQADYDDAWERWGIQDYVWSPDSKWIAYTKMEESLNEAIFLYSVGKKKVQRLTWDRTQDWSPSFDPKGRYLYFLSNRTFSPIMGFVDQNHIFLDLCRPYMFILKDGEPAPFASQDSEEKIEEAVEDEKDGKAADENEDEEKEPEEDAEKEQKKEKDEDDGIDLAGIERRIVVAKGVSAGNYFRLEATDQGFLYLQKDGNEFSKYQSVTDDTGGRLDLYHYNLDDAKTTKVLDGIANYHQSANGKKMVYRAGSTYGVVGVGAKSKVGDGKVDLGGIQIKVDRSKEFLQLLDEAWRIQRDWFYDPGMHGVDWEGMRQKYRKFVPFCSNRSDLNYLIGEMIGELNIGHTYVYGGDIESNAKNVRTGLLGADFVAKEGAEHYRIAHIIPGTPGETRERSPLDEPGCPIKVGDYVIAIDGEDIKTTDNIYRHLQNKSDTVIKITYNDQPTVEGAKTYRLRTLGSEQGIRYREWVENNRAFVDEATNGQVGYLHIPDMGADGLVEFAKAYFPYHYKKAFILDERYNGGGFTADMIIDRLERKLWGITQPREGKKLRDPERAFYGHLAVIVNEDTGSCGEFFAEAIKLKGLAPIIGMRTWGGAIGIEPHQSLADGGGVTPPQFGLYGLNREWLIEGHGVVPDIEVQNMPGDVVRGKDAQLERTVEYLLKKIAEEPRELPDPPSYPDKNK